MLRKLSYLTVDWPLRQESLFPRAQPLIVEIGFGNGDHLLHLAQTRPDCNVIGLEISSQSMDRAETKIGNHKLENVRPIHCRAETALAHLLEPRSVREFHINFPDPWFKKKHGRRRLIKRKTVDYLTSRMIEGGRLHLATDIIAYATMAHEVFSATPGLSNRLASAWARETAGRFQTKYEIKAYAEGRRSHFFLYERNGAPVAHPPVIRDLEMPHLMMTSAYSAADLVERFEAWRRRFGPVHIAVLRAYANPKQDVAVFEVVVEEPTIEQHALISMSPRADAGHYIVKMTSLGHARPTEGMHRAVQAVGEWVAGLDEESAIVARNLRG